MAKRRSKGRASTGNSKESTPQISDNEASPEPPSKRKKPSGPKTSSDLCQEFNIENVELEYTDADYQNLTTYNLFVRLIRPQIAAANPKFIPASKMNQLMEAKWREFNECNPFNKEKEEEQDGDSEVESASNTEDYEKEQSSDDSGPSKKRRSKGSSQTSAKSEGSLKIKLPLFGVRKSARERKPVKKLTEADKFFDSDEDSQDNRRKRKAKKTLVESDDDFESDGSGPSRHKRRSSVRNSSARKRKKESSDEASAISSESSSELSSDSDERSRRKGRNKSAKKEDRAVIPGERRSERARKSNSASNLKEMTDREFEKMLKQEAEAKKGGSQQQHSSRDGRKKKKGGSGKGKISGKRGTWQGKEEVLSGEESDHCWYCALCNDGGDLMLCDGCPKSFHQKCLKLETVPEGEWKCPVCTGEGLPELSDKPDSETEEEEEEGKHDHFCKECKLGGDLLLCDFCPSAYHMKCLNPVLKEVPDDDWKCPRCVVLENPLTGAIQQVLTWKWVNVEQGKDDELDHTTSPRKKSFQDKEDEDSKGETPKKRPERHMFVKYKYHSYWNCEWIPEIAYEVHARQSWSFFRRKWDQDEPPALDDGGTVRHKKTVDPHNMDERFYRWGIKPEWLQIHRILTHEKETSKLNKYLVKWRDLPYEECTWEAEDDLPEGLQDWDKQIQSYWTRRKEKEAPRKKDSKKEKPKKKDLKKKLEKQPTYLDTSGGKLHPYQLEGLNWMRFSWAQDTNVILADEMGLGKTIQAISFLYSLWKEGYAPGPFIISAPLSTVANWEREFEFWAPEMYVVTYVGHKESRQIIREREFCYKDGCFYQTSTACRFREGFSPKFDVLLTSYEMVSVDKGTLCSIPYSVLVIDEAHRLKSNQSLFFRVMTEYKIDFQLLLTGTPLQNNLEELFNLLNFLEPKKFDDMQSFLEEFADISKDEQVKRLHEMLAPHMLRRLKMDVMKEIPDKCELIVRVELSSMQKKFYKHILTKNYSALNVRGHGNQTSLANIMMDLRKCCNHPYLFPTADQDAPKTKRGLYEGSALTKAAGKLELLEKMLKVLKAQGHRVLLFSQMTRILDIVEDFMDHHGYHYERIDGSVTGTDRQTRIDRFNDPKSSSFVFLLSTKAGGLGINLATADTVVIYDMDWNPHNDIQAFSRAHRIGQKNKVMIYRFVSRNTVEEKMTQVCKQKMMLSELVIAKGGGEKKDSLSKQEVNAILKFGAEDLFKDTEEGQVTYNMAAVEKLLDRSQAGEVEKQFGMNEYLRSFNVATYQVKEGVEEEEEPQEEEVEQPAVISAVETKENEDSNYWQRVLGDAYTEHILQLTKEQEEIARSLGKGKRMRKKINYAETALMDFIPQKDKKKMLHVEVLEEDEDNDEKYMSDYKPDDGESSSSDEDSEAENMVPDNLPETEAMKKSKQILQKAQELRKQHDRSKKDKGPETLPPLLAKVNGQIEVLGFTARHRRSFLDAVMRYGLPPEDAYRSQWLVRDLRMKTERVFKAYMSLFMRHLCEPIPEDADKFADGVPREGLSRQHVLTRIGMIALLRRKVNEYEKVNFTDSMMEFSKSEQNNDKTEEQVYKSLLSHFSIQTHKTDDKKGPQNEKDGAEKVKKANEGEKKEMVENGKTEDSDLLDKDSEKVNGVEENKNESEIKEKEGKTTESASEKATESTEEDLKEKEEVRSQENVEGSKEKEEEEISKENAEGSKEKEEEETSKENVEGSKENEEERSKENTEGLKETEEEKSKENGEGSKVNEGDAKEEQNNKESEDSAKTEGDKEGTSENPAESSKSENSKAAEKNSKKDSSFTLFKPRTLADIQTELRKRFWVSDGGFTELHAVWNHEESLLIPGREWEMWHRRHDYWLLTGVITHGYRHWQDIMNDPRFDIINKAFRSDADRLKRAAFLNRRFQLLEQALVIEEQLRKAAIENPSHFKAAVKEAEEAQGVDAAKHLLVQVDQFAANLRKISHNMKVAGPPPDNKVHKAISTLSGLITDIRQITYKTMPSTLAMTEHGAQSARQSMLARKLQQEAAEGKVITVE